MAKYNQNDTIDFGDDKKLVISSVSFSKQTSTALLPSFDDFNNIAEVMYAKIPDLPYRVSNTTNSDRFSLERADGSESLTKVDIPAKKITEYLLDYMIEKDMRKIYFDKDFEPILMGTYREAIFLGVINSLDMSPIDFSFLKSLLDKSIDSNEYMLINEEAELRYISETIAGYCIVPYFYDHIELSYPGILVDVNLEDSVKFSSDGVKLFLEFWIRNMGIDSAYFTTKLEDEHLLALCPDVIESTGLSTNIVSRVNSDAFMDYIVKHKLIHLADIDEDKEDKKTALIGPVKPTPIEGLTDFKGFGDNIYSALEFPSDITMWVEATWICFINNYKKLKVGCDVILSPNEIVLNPKNELVFYADEILSMKYIGENHKVDQNKLKVICPPDVPNNTFTRISDYFKDYTDIRVEIKKERIKES
ncbi:MAG: hypothetical protein ACXAC2_00575 [Candidatus Kariarchaeaceae archaeon]